MGSFDRSPSHTSVISESFSGSTVAPPFSPASPPISSNSPKTTMPIDPSTVEGGAAATVSRTALSRTPSLKNPSLSSKSLSQTVLLRGQTSSSNFVSLMGYASPSSHDIEEFKGTLRGFEGFYQDALASVQMDLRKRAPLKIEIKTADKSLVNPQVRSLFSRAASYEAPEEVIQALKRMAPKHEEFIRRVRSFSRSPFASQDSIELLKGHSQLLRKLHARLIQARDGYPEIPEIHREYSQLAERILHLQLCSRPDVEDGTLGSSLSVSRLFSSPGLVERISFTDEHHADWVKGLFEQIRGPFTDANRGGLLQLSAIEEHFNELDRSGKSAVATHLAKHLKESFNIDLQNFKRLQVFSPEALEFFTEILTTILPTMGLESDDWIVIHPSEFPEEIRDLMEKLEITLLEREGKCVVFSKSLDDFGVADGYVRSCVNTPLGALTSEMDPKKLEKFLRLSKPLATLLQNKNVSHVCFSGVLRTGAYMQLLRYQTEKEAQATNNEMYFCGVFRGALDYLPLYSRFSQLDALKYECEATDLSTHHMEDSWAMKTPNLTTIPGALLHHQAEFTSLGVADRTLNLRDPSRYIFGQDRYIGYFVEVMRICQQLVDKIRPLRFGANEERAMILAEVEALLGAEKTSGILEVESFPNKVHSLEAAITADKEFAPGVCWSLRSMPLTVAKAHAELLPLYRRIELYLETGDLSHLQGFTKLSKYHYGIQDTEGNNLIFCTGIYNTPLIAGPSTRGIEGFPVSTTMEAPYCSKELCERIRAFCGPNPTTYIGCGAAADSVTVMGRLHKNVSAETAISVVCFAPRLGEWGMQYRDAKVATDERLKEQNQHKVEIISIVSTSDPCFTDRGLKKRLEKRGIVLAFNTVSEPALSNAAALARRAAETVASVEREDFSPYFGPSIRCLERYVTLRRVLEPVFNEGRGGGSPLELSQTAAETVGGVRAFLGEGEDSLLHLTARKICEFIDQKTSMFPTKRFKQFLTAYGEAALIASSSLNTGEEIQNYLDDLAVRVESLAIQREELEEQRTAFIQEAPQQEARLKERESQLEHTEHQQAELRIFEETLSAIKTKVAQIKAFLQQNKELMEELLDSLYQRNGQPGMAACSNATDGAKRVKAEEDFRLAEPLYQQIRQQLRKDPDQPFLKELHQAIQECPGCQDAIKELIQTQYEESSRLKDLLLEDAALSETKRVLEQNLRSLRQQQEEESVVEQEEIVQKIKGIDKTLKALQIIERAIHDNIDIPDEALLSFATTTRRLPAYTRFTLISDPKVRAGYAALQARYLFGKTPEYHLAFLADVGESHFAANSQNGARLVRDLATGKYAVVFKPVKAHLSWKDFAKRKAGQISHTLVSDGGMREMEQWNEIWAQALGRILSVSCTLTEGGVAKLTNGESGVALPFLTGYKPASQCKGTLDRLHHKEQLGKVHDFFAINMISGDQDGHLENWMILEEDGVLKNVRWIDAGNAFTWSDPSSWLWGGFSANYRAWKSLAVSRKPFEGVFSRASIKQKLSSYDYAGVQQFAADSVDFFKRNVDQGRFAELLRGDQQKREHFELVLTRMQRRLEALLLYICITPEATPAGAAEYTYDEPQAWTRFTDWSIVSFIQNNKSAPFMN